MRLIGTTTVVLYPYEQRRTMWIFKSENSFQVSFVKETVGNFSRALGTTLFSEGVYVRMA